MPRLIARVLASIVLTLAACAPSRPPSPTTASQATVITVPTPVGSTGPSAVPVAQPSVSPAATSGPDVKIVEPPFRQPQEWAYTPAELSVKLGTTVLWTNTGAVAHTVTADDGQAFDSGTIDPKATFSLTPNAPGTFAYHCTFHAWMKATILVTS